MTFEARHTEVVEALRAIGDPVLGEAIRIDRGSQLEHLGIRFPDLRRRVKQGFSFSALPPAEVLATWDYLWKASPYGDVLFAALEYYLPRARRDAASLPWPLLREWAARVDNWCHCDLLANLYSHILEAQQPEVLPQLKAWNAAQSEWERRLSLVSLIHYSGKNAVFLPPDLVFPLVANCLSDRRHYVQTAAGWVLREMGEAFPAATLAFLEANAPLMGAEALTRALERRAPEERAYLRNVRRASL